MSGLPNPQPDRPVGLLTLDEVYTPGEFYGVKVSWLGEEPESTYVAFTHDQRRAVAALHRLTRTDGGDRATAIDHDQTLWVQAIATCGCTDHEEPGHDCDNCKTLGLPPCRDDFAWVMEHCEPDAPNAIPAMRFELEF